MGYEGLSRGPYAPHSSQEAWSVASDIPGSRTERQPRRGPSLTTLFGSWLRVSARSTPRPAGRLVVITMGASSIYSSSRRTDGPAANQLSGRQLVNLGQGSEVRHRCDCCCLRDAHASSRAQAAGLPRGRIGIGRQHSAPLPGQGSSDGPPTQASERDMMLRGLGWRPGEARKHCKLAIPHLPWCSRRGRQGCDATR